MLEADFNKSVTADIKSIVSRCVCGAEDYPSVERGTYWQMYRITCDHCERILYAPTRDECLRDWASISKYAALLDAVNRVLALLDDEADVVDDDHGGVRPNESMRIAQELREVIARAEGRS
jgi:hypothetical protein